jgi:transcriptional regulator with XRE-family HTH domain
MKKLLLALGERIARQRKTWGISLEELSARAGISKGNLSEIERGKRDPRFTTLHSIATGLETSVADLVEDKLGERHLYSVGSGAPRNKNQSADRTVSKQPERRDRRKG